MKQHTILKDDLIESREDSFIPLLVLFTNYRIKQLKGIEDIVKGFEKPDLK